MPFALYGMPKNDRYSCTATGNWKFCYFDIECLPLFKNRFKSDLQQNKEIYRQKIKQTDRQTVRHEELQTNQK